MKEIKNEKGCVHLEDSWTKYWCGDCGDYAQRCGCRGPRGIYGREKAKMPVTVINTPIMPEFGMEDDGKWEYVNKTVIDWVREQDKRTEQQIFKEVTDWAKEHNIGTVYLIDEEFVKTALLNEIERRKEVKDGKEN